MKTVMISGADGQLVTDIQKTLQKEGSFHVVAYNRSRLDVTDKLHLETEFRKINPDFFIQGASYHVVEEINQNPKKACDVNVASLHYLSDLCNEYDCTLINFSTNYVFSGKSNTNFDQLKEVPRHYNEMDLAQPVNLYGILKYAGEQVVSTNCNKYYNIRVSGLFGETGSRAKNGMNFPYIIKKNLELSNRDDPRDSVEVVADQTINVSYTVDLANVIVEMMKQERKDKYGVYHLVNKGDCTWYEVAQEIADILGYEKDKIKPIETEDFYTNLKRPKDTSLNIGKVERKFGVDVPTWKDALRRFFEEIA
jgi:dTDP-4-dehydrorhamnose reductase